VVKVLCYKSEGRWFDPSRCHWNFSFRSHYGPGVDSASNRKGDRCLRVTTLPISCVVVIKSENLKFLEPLGPLQACNESALPLPLPYRFRGLLFRLITPNDTHTHTHTPSREEYSLDEGPAHRRYLYLYNTQHS